ncbi:MAG: LysM peptidoglycan-binding domain-containing protein [Halioglobus sp.]|nr:LysM peptidoglycan-binding domain-containing protein [Halioglobus sp.]
MKNLIKIQLVLVLSLCVSAVNAQTLKGSRESIDKQYRTAVSYGFTFVKSASALKSAISANQLIHVTPDRYLELHDVSFPYAVPGTRLFLSRLSSQYYSSCGEKLTVTSLLRPQDRQPANSVAHSVHPTGMAVDLRVPKSRQCRAWLENTLLSLEREKVVDVTRERYPPHYHVAVYAEHYETRVAKLSGESTRSSASTQKASTQTASTQGTSFAGSYQRYVVRKGDTLSEIAKRNGVQVAQLRAVNTLRGNLINVGQKLRIPTGAASSDSPEVVATYTTTHRVNRGDTLWQIANRYGTSVKQLRQVNGSASDVLQVGQVLKISKG